MIKYVQGDLFGSKADALVNPVNCVGVMGKGLALDFRLLYPKMYANYATQCAHAIIRVGQVTWFEEDGKTIFNFPTKAHWKDASRLEDIVEGLCSLKSLIAFLDVKSIAIPALGCGLGGLDWADVRWAIELELGSRSMKEVDIEVYEPVGT